MQNEKRLSQRGIIAGLCLFAGELTAQAELPVYELEPIYVSSPRFSSIDLKVASRVQLIGREAIEASNATNLVTLLEEEANLHFRSTSGNSALSELSMGGFGESSGQRALILLDGQRLNTADLGQINWLSIPISLVESVEVIKGGQSALYGNNAVGGVIKINTQRPTESFSGVVSGSVGSFNAYNGRFAISGREGSLGFSAHAEHDETDGYRDNAGYEADGGGLRVDWTPNDWFSGYGSFSGVSSEYGLPGPLTRAEYENDPRQTTEPDNEGEEDAIYFRGGLGFCLGDDFTFSLDGGYTDRELFTNFVSSGASIEQEYSIRSLSPTLTYEEDAVTAVFGVDYYDDGVDGVSVFFGTTPFEYDRETLAGFTSTSIALSESWQLNASARVEEASTDGVYGGVGLDEQVEEAYAWALGLVHFVGDSGRVYGSVRRFYRYPATDEILLFFPGIAFNPAIDPEHGHEVEVGLDWVFGQFDLSARLYYQEMDDEIIYDPTIGMFGANTNLDATERVGADLGLSYQLTKAMAVSMDYTWVDATIASGTFDGSEVPLVPEHKARLALSYRPDAPFSFSVAASYTNTVYIGGDFANAQRQLDDYVLLDLSARYAVSEAVDVFVEFENLTDEKYVSTAFGADALYPGVGRSARIGLHYRF